jgi:hypothetical protein
MSLHLGDLSDIVYSSIGFGIIRLAYGDQVAQQCGRELVAINSESMQLATWANSQVWLVNIIPIGLSLFIQMIPRLKPYIARFLPSWLPGLKFPAYAKQGRETFDKIRYWAFTQVKQETVGQTFLAVKDARTNRSINRRKSQQIFVSLPNTLALTRDLMDIFVMRRA